MKKKQLMAWLLGGCLLLGLAACKQSKDVEDESVSYAEDIQMEKDAEAAKQDQLQETDSETNEVEESDQNQKEQSGESDSDQKQTEDSADDSEQDGEARNEISKTEAKESIVAAFGSNDPDNGRAYEYDFLSVEEIGDRQYYVYKMTWAADDQDGGAKSKTLNYIFVATDGSTIHTGTVDDDGYEIDYTS